MMTPEVMIVVLNWNRGCDTTECLHSLMESDCAPCRIMVVDNGSTDDSVQTIRREHPGIIMLETRQNLGYAGGNNVGIRYALGQGADYVCIVNNDVRVAPDFLEPLLAALEADATVAVVTPLIAKMDQPEEVWALGQTLEWRTGLVTRALAGQRLQSFKAGPPVEVDVASGAVMLVKREALEHVGLLDDAFYLYYEEVDWCLRVSQAGYRILAVPASVVWHRVSATLGQTSPVIDYYMLRNHLRLIARHWTGLARWQALGLTALRNAVTIGAYTAKPHGGQRLPHRDARMLALRDVVLGRWGKMGPDVEAVCHPRSAV